MPTVREADAYGGRSVTGSTTHAATVPTMVRTLIGNRFILDGVTTKPHYVLFTCHRYDEFGLPMPYVFALCGETPLGRTSAQAVARTAKARGAQAVAISDASCDPLASLSWPAFLARCGGPIRSWLPLEPTYPTHLHDLGHNRAVVGVDGKTDDLFEEYVHVGLQFFLGDRVIRYGQERRGEALPDGIAFAQGSIILPYDAKAYKGGYDVTHDSIRQFGSYVRDFDSKYQHYLGRAYAFLLVSGHFENGERGLANQSRALRVECGVDLVYMTAADLGAATTLLAQQPALRPAINWRDVFSHTLVTLQVIQDAVDAARRDGVVRT